MIGQMWVMGVKRKGRGEMRKSRENNANKKTIVTNLKLKLTLSLRLRRFFSTLSLSGGEGVVSSPPS